MNRFAVAIAVLCAVLAVRPLLASDGVEPLGISLPATARGGADVAVGDTALSQIENPATLTLMPRSGPRLDTSGKIAFLDSRWRGPLGTAETERPNIPLASTAVSFPINNRLTLGTGLHTKAGLGTAYHQRHLLIPFLKRYVSSDLKDISVPVNMGYQLTDKLSVGGGVRMEAVTARFETVLGPAAVEFGRGESLGAGFDLGLLYRLRKDLAFGLAYRSTTWCSDLEGGKGKASLLGVLPVPLGDIGVDRLRLPQRVAAGFAWDVTSRLKLVGDVRWINYRNSSLHSFTVQTDGLVDLRVALPLGYRDVWAFMAGPQYQLSEHWKVAAGYHYSMPAVPPSHLLPIGSIISGHHATTGIWYETKKWRAGIDYTIAFPESLSGRGCSEIPLGIDYGFSSLRQMQQAIGVGFGWQW